MEANPNALFEQQTDYDFSAGRCVLKVQYPIIQNESECPFASERPLLLMGRLPSLSSCTTKAVQRHSNDSDLYR